MRRFLIKHTDINGARAVLSDTAEIHHLLHVLRFKVGEKVQLLDGMGGEYLSQIHAVSRQQIELKILSTNQAGAIPELPLQLTLATAFVKRQQMDFIVEKAVEFGVTEIVPMKTERSVVDIRTGARQGRWERIIRAAAKQSGQAILPTISPITEFNEFLEGICRGDSRIAPAFLLTPNPSGENFAKVLLEKKDLGKKICLMIGPEGGWSSREEEKAIVSGAIPVRLAENTLRCETAVVAALALIVNLNILKDL